MPASLAGMRNTNYDFWRPVIGIRNAGVDGNPQTVADPNWTPLAAPASNQSGTNFTPPFPSYASGHATFGGAVFETLARFYGRDNITFTFTSDELNGVTTDQNGVVRPLAPRTFTSFSQAAEENGQSRIYLGIHWSFDKTAGIACGDHIADYNFNRILQPLKFAMPSGRPQSAAVRLHEDAGGNAIHATERRRGSRNRVAKFANHRPHYRVHSFLDPNAVPDAGREIEAAQPGGLLGNDGRFTRAFEQEIGRNRVTNRRSCNAVRRRTEWVIINSPNSEFFELRLVQRRQQR